MDQATDFSDFSEQTTENSDLNSEFVNIDTTLGLGPVIVRVKNVQSDKFVPGHADLNHVS